MIQKDQMFATPYYQLDIEVEYKIDLSQNNYCCMYFLEFIITFLISLFSKELTKS